MEFERENKPVRKRESHFVCVCLSGVVLVALCSCAGEEAQGPLVFGEAASFSLFVPLCFLFPGVLLSRASLSIWPAAREQWLMVEIRIETSLDGYRRSLSLDLSLSSSFCFCLFISVYFLTLTVPHSLLFSVFLLVSLVFHPHSPTRLLSPENVWL